MKKTLTFDQTKRLLAAVAARRKDKALVTALLLCGGGARTWTWKDALSQVVELPSVVFWALKDLAVSKRLTLIPFNHQYFKPGHWVGDAAEEAVFSVSAKPLTTQEVTRRLKVYARRAGIEPGEVSLRTLGNTHHALMDLYGGDADALAEALGLTSPLPLDRSGKNARLPRPPFDMDGVKRKIRDARLHGIGRRVTAMKTA